MIKTRGQSDVYFTHLKIPPGGHGGWHSHPGPSVIAVRAGTATFYDECDDFAPQVYPAGTGFVEDGNACISWRTRGTLTWRWSSCRSCRAAPRGAPRRIDEPDPRD